MMHGQTKIKDYIVCFQFFKKIRLRIE